MLCFSIHCFSYWKHRVPTRMISWDLSSILQYPVIQKSQANTWSYGCLGFHWIIQSGGIQQLFISFFCAIGFYSSLFSSSWREQRHLLRIFIRRELCKYLRRGLPSGKYHLYLLGGINLCIHCLLKRASTHHSTRGTNNTYELRKAVSVTIRTIPAAYVVI